MTDPRQGCFPFDVPVDPIPEMERQVRPFERHAERPKGQYASIWPSEQDRLDRLPARALKVFTRHALEVGGRTEPPAHRTPMAVIAAEASLSIRTVRRANAELSKAGLIEVTQKPFGAGRGSRVEVLLRHRMLGKTPGEGYDQGDRSVTLVSDQGDRSGTLVSDQGDRSGTLTLRNPSLRRELRNPEPAYSLHQSADEWQPCGCPPAFHLEGCPALERV